MDDITKTFAELVAGTEMSARRDLVRQGKRAFIDYLAAALAATHEPPVERLGRLLGGKGGVTPLLGRNETAVPESAALFNGFTSHYLDYDDAQANVMGHISTVIFSALLAVTDGNDRTSDFLNAYMAGAEIEGILGHSLNPCHKKRGFHPTATLGAIGAAAAIARYKRLSVADTAEVLSLGATQAAGLGLEAGSDAKPLHSGFAARNGVTAYLLHMEAGLTASDRPFDNKEGWVRTVGGNALAAEDIRRSWLSPGQLLSPGLWMKEHQYCSGAICGVAGCRELYRRGYTMRRIKKVVFHFPAGADVSLHYIHPRTGQEGRFSMEYVAWQALTYGDVDDKLFLLTHVPDAFEKALPRLKRSGDLPKAPKEHKEIRISLVTNDGEYAEANVLDPPGSPQRPFTDEELKGKLTRATSEAYAEKALQVTETWPEGRMEPVLGLLGGVEI